MTHPLAAAALYECGECLGTGLIPTPDPNTKTRSVSPCTRCDGAGHHLVIKETA